MYWILDAYRMATLHTNLSRKKVCSIIWAFHVYLCRTFAWEAGRIAAQHSQGIVRWQRCLADCCDEGITRRHQAQTTTQRGHSELCLQDVLCGRLIGAEETGQDGGTKRVETHLNKFCFQFMDNSFSTAWFPKVCIQHDWWKSSYWKESPLTSRLVAETEQPIDHTSRHWPSPPTPGGLLRKNHKAFVSLFTMHFTSV